MRIFDRRLLIRLILASDWSFSVWIYGYQRFFKVTEWFSRRVDDRRLLFRSFIGLDGNPRGWIHGDRWILKATESLSMRFGDLCLGSMIVLQSMRISIQEESEVCCVFRFGFKAKPWGLVPGRDMKEYGPILGFSIDVLLAMGLFAMVDKVFSMPEVGKEASGKIPSRVLRISGKVMSRFLRISGFKLVFAFQILKVHSSRSGKESAVEVITKNSSCFQVFDGIQSLGLEPTMIRLDSVELGFWFGLSRLTQGSERETKSQLKAVLSRTRSDLDVQGKV
ncbi:unnamed protein product [Arabidopsis lyrata]|nr:unnamed protein product [Arabidopsis lyrata]